MSRYLRVPQFPVPGLPRFFEDIIAAMDRDFNDKMDKTTGNHSLLLIAPDGSVWEVKVTDAGALTTVKVAAG
jgi:hypothetical protein